MCRSSVLFSLSPKLKILINRHYLHLMNCHRIKAKSVLISGTSDKATKRHEMSNPSSKQNKNQLSPSLSGARRLKTDLNTSENVFLQSCSRSRSSSPILPQKVAKSCETSKATGNSAIRCNEMFFFLLSFAIEKSFSQIIAKI